MATKIVNVAVPASAGFGAQSNISDLVGEKTVQLSGTFTGAYVLYVSQDGVGWAPLLSFESGGGLVEIKKTFAGSFQVAKIMCRASDASGVTANVSGLEEVGANTFTGFIIPAGFNGLTPTEDLGLVNYQEDLCGIIKGGFVGTIVFYGSMDGTNFNPFGSISAPPAAANQQPIEFSPLYTSAKVRYVQARVLGHTTTAVVLTMGGRQDTTLNPAQFGAVAALAAANAVTASLVDADTSAVPAAGYLYRSNGLAGQVVKAQADTVAHASAVIGVGHATLGLAPLAGMVHVVFDAAPIVGGPAYLSATAEGKASNTRPSLGFLPFGMIADNTSAGAAYSAWVQCPYASVTSGKNLEQTLLEETALDLGGMPDNYDVQFHDFGSQLSQVGNYTFDNVVVAGALCQGSVATLTGVTCSAVQSRAEAVLPAGNASAVPWRLSARMYPNTVDTGAKVLQMFVDTAAIGIGLFPSLSATQWSYYDEWVVVSTGGVPAAVTNIGAKSGGYDQLDLESDGANHMRYRLNDGAWSAWIDMAHTTTSYAQFMINNFGPAESLKVDWLFFALKAR